MSNALIAALVGMTTLLAAFGGVVYSYGQMAERVAVTSQQLEVLTGKVEALSLDVSGGRLEVMRLLASRDR